MITLSQPAIVVLQAVLGVALLTFAMAVWSGLSRLLAMKQAGLELEDAAHVSEFQGRLPSTVRRVNDNYNHLLEAPTVFYAVAIATVVLGVASEFIAGCAVAYLVLRFAHSLVQATINRVAVRAPLYILSWLVLATMIIVGLNATLGRGI